MIVVRADSFGMTPMNNPVGAFVYNAHPGLVDTVLVDGALVKRGGRLRRRRRRARAAPGDRGARRDIMRRPAGQAGARIGGDWIPEAYVGGGGMTSAPDPELPPRPLPADAR